MSRRFTSRRRISLSDTGATGRLRLDAIARYLQDAATEDWLDAGFDLDSHVWVVRRTEIELHEAFRAEDAVEVETWCSGVAGSAAARRYSLRGSGGGRAEAESIWIHLDRSLRPKRLGERFLHVYGASAAERRAPTRFTLPDPPAARSEQPWPLRAADEDRLGHVNNAAFWFPLEELWSEALAPPARVTVEYRKPIDRDDRVLLAHAANLAWLVVGEEARSAARLDPEGARETE